MTEAGAGLSISKRISRLFGVSETKRATAPEIVARTEEPSMFQMRKSEANGNGEAAVFSAASTKETRRDAAWLAARLARSKQFRSGEIETETVQISPALAEMMLEHNADNRPLRQKYVGELAALIRGGRWRLTSQGISFARDGTLNNGQHRLSAIIAAGVTVPVQVSFGEDRDIFPMLDTGKGRSGGDALHIAGYKFWNNLAAAARLYKFVTSENPHVNQRLNPEDILDIVEHNKQLEDVCADGSRIAQKLKCPSAPIITALYLIKKNSAEADRLPVFIGRLADGDELRRRDPILVLRNMIVQKGFEAPQRGGTGIANTSLRLCAGVVLAWNKWITVRTASDSALRWNGVTDFPQAE